MAPDDFRCSFASLADGEPMVGTAPTEQAYLFVESPGPWGHDAVAENRLPQDVREHLQRRDLKVFVIRRHSPSKGAGTRVFHARRSASGFEVRTTHLADPADLLALDLAAPGDDLVPHDGPLWLVCTNSKRDQCCALAGRPVVRALEERWPEDTWEVSHLGGHRFAATMMALPSGWVLGRLDDSTALASAEALLRGDVPVQWCRGRAGLTGAEQVHELHVLGGGSPDARVVVEPGPVRRQSCGDLKEKSTTTYRVLPG